MAIVVMMIPLSLLGAAWGHGIHAHPISILSAWGMVALSGVVINDAVVFLSKYNQLILEGNKVEEAVFKAGAGTIGNYQNCLNDYEVSGQFKPVAGSNPSIGKQDKLEKVVERKLEFFVDSFNLNQVIMAMKSVHPYETPAYAVYPQQKQSENFGLGLIGELNEKQTITDYAKFVKKQLGAKFVKLWLADRNPLDSVKKIAVCGGTGTSLLQKAYGRADIFVSADFTHHILMDSKIPIIDAGHFYTENPVLENIKEMLSEFKLEIIFLPPEEHDIQKEIIL